MTKKVLQNEVFEWSPLQTEISQSAVVLKGNANTKQQLVQESRTKWIQPTIWPQLCSSDQSKVKESTEKEECTQKETKEDSISAFREIFYWK